MKVSPRVFTPADWLKAKPYNQLSAYDSFYVQQCRELYALLLDYQDFFTEANLERDDLVVGLTMSMVTSSSLHRLGS